MTKVRRIVKRETEGDGVLSAGKIRAVIVSVEPPNLLGFRLKGTRRTYYLTAEWGFMQAVQAAVREEKRQKRKSRRPGRRTVKRGVV